MKRAVPRTDIRPTVTAGKGVTRRKGCAPRLVAVALLFFTLSGCAAGGLRSDGTVDPEAPLEERQKGVAAFIEDMQGDGVERRARAAEVLPQYGSIAVPPLVEVAGSGDLDDRLLALSLLGEMGGESREALPFLIETLEDEDEFVRLTAAEVLGRIPASGKGSITALRKALSDPSPFVREQAAGALVALYRLQLEESDPFARVDIVRSLGETGSAGVPLLLEILRGGDGYIRPAAAEVLGTTGVSSAEVVGALVDAIEEDQYTLTRRVLQSLHQFGPDAAPALPALIQHLDSGGSVLTKQTIRIIGNIGPAARSAAPDIAPYLKSEDVATRWYTAQALFDLGLRPDGVIPVFVETLHHGGNTYERSRPYFALLGEKILPFLLPLLDHENDMVRSRAASTIGMSGASPDKTFPRLVELLDDDHTRVRAEAIQAMVGIGSQSPESAVPYLLPSLESADPNLRVGAAAVLVVIDPGSLEGRRVLVDSMSSGEKNSYYPAAVGLLGLGEEGVRIAAERLTADRLTRCGAANTLAAMGEMAVPAVPDLIKVVAEDTGTVRRCAILALRSIGPGARAAVPVLIATYKENRATYIHEAAASALKSIDPAVLPHLPLFE